MQIKQNSALPFPISRESRNAGVLCSEQDQVQAKLGKPDRELSKSTSYWEAIAECREEWGNAPNMASPASGETLNYEGTEQNWTYTL